MMTGDDIFGVLLLHTQLCGSSSVFGAHRIRRDLARDACFESNMTGLTPLAQRLFSLCRILWDVGDEVISLRGIHETLVNLQGNRVLSLSSFLAAFVIWLHLHHFRCAILLSEIHVPRSFVSLAGCFLSLTCATHCSRILRIFNSLRIRQAVPFSLLRHYRSVKP